MAIEIFLVPMIGSGTRLDPWRPAYVYDPQVVQGAATRYSSTDVAVAVIDAPQSYLDFVAGQAGVTRLATETNIDDVLTAGQASAAQAIFEAEFIPGQFINAGDTRREAIRGVIGLFLFSQRLEGRFGEGFRARAQARGVTLNSTWQEFPAALQQEFLDIRDDHGWTNAELGVTNTSTLRQIMQAVSQQWENTPFNFKGFEI